LPKLLDFIKDKGLSHEQVMELIEGSLVEEPGEEEAPEIEDGEDEEKIQLYQTDNRSEEPETSEEESEEDEEIKTIELTPEELATKIAEGVAKELEATRKVPSKGRIVDRPQSDIPVVKKNWFEEIV